MNEGKLLPDRILNSGVKRAIVRSVGRPLLFDGYPRTLDQAHFLYGVLKEFGYTLLVIELDLDDRTSIKRIQSRFVCSACGSIIYSGTQTHLTGIKKYRQLRHTCIHCGGTLVKRSDDTAESVRYRLALYHRQTEPVMKYFTDLSVVHYVDARASIEKVFASLNQIVRQHQ